MSTWSPEGDDYTEFTIHSHMYLPYPVSGHVGGTSYPCVVTALWRERTGTVLIQTIMCNGRAYDILEVSKDDLRKFYDQIYEVICAIDL